MAPAHSKIIYGEENEHIFPYPYLSKQEKIDIWINKTPWLGTIFAKKNRAIASSATSHFKDRRVLESRYYIYCYKNDEYVLHPGDTVEELEDYYYRIKNPRAFN